ncbi:mechanosensitive ion channel family protein [Haloarculaceae archaeon H-GB2-1]|nr:mechanosensitive ion channel family protein [Haloarculaceae archaeon H-GB1-1]MEA5387024.1 mechanosensitive ion channel family protein [Haloarculaceae archaeon H-GB11]MEA5408526.1 mechanosensitive ion channel family protein [Haloarculaceae archaeon H-GB2-1]
MLAQVPPWIVDTVQAIIVLGLGYLVSRVIVGIAGRRIARRLRRPSLTRTALRGIRVGVFIVVGLTVMRIYGLQLSDISLSVAVFSAVVGVVLAPIVGSVISGLFLLADQPYEIGDMIELADTNQRGFVEDITLRYTKVFTLDNTFVVIPNGTMRERDVVNYSAEDTRTRQSLQLLVTYEGDLDEAREIMQGSAKTVDEVIEGGPDIRIGSARYPAGPTCYIENYADHGVLLNLRFWVKEPYKLLRVRSKVQERIWERLADADVEIAYPHSHLVFDETSGELPVAMNGRGRQPGVDKTIDEFE